MTREIERARSALMACDAGVSRADWVRLLAAAKAAGVDFDTVDAWSASAPNYRNTKDVQSVWRGLREGGGISENTLFYLARQEGWKDGQEAPTRADISALVAKAQQSRPAPPEAAKRPAMDPAEVWSRCRPATAEHGYIARKDGLPDGLRVYPADAPRLTIAGQDVAGWLVVPCQAPAGELQSLQFIPPQQGKKLNLPGATMAGGLHVVGELLPDGLAYVCEGISAAWAAWKATGRAAVVAFGWGNVAKVAPALAERYPALSLALLPDVGKEASAAEIAASVPRCGWVELPAGMDQNSDVGDFAAVAGLDALEQLLTDGVQHPPKPEPRYRALSAADLMKLPPIRWRVRGVLPAAGIAAVFGPSGSGKSFVVIDLAASLALGRPDWFGHKLKPCNVAYVCLEGTEGLRNRIDAWQTHHFMPAPAGLHFFCLDNFDLMNPKDARELAACVLETAGPGCMVVIDTLAQACPGMDENSSADMGLALRGAKLIQAATGGLVLLVHHTGKDTTKGMRGHSSLRAALDAAIEVSRDGDRREWKVEKSKDGQDGQAAPFRLRVVDLGTDDYGEPVTSCVALPDDAPATAKSRRKPLTKASHKAAFEKLGEMLKASRHRGRGSAPDDRPCLELEAYMEAIRPLMECTREKDRGTYAQRAVTAMRDHGLIDCADSWVWML